MKLGRVRTPWWHRAIERLIALFASSAILAVIAIGVFVFREAWPLLVDDDALTAQGGLSSLFRPRLWPGYDEPLHVWQPVGFPGKLDVIPLVVGTLKITGLTMAIAIPLGIGGAIFLSEVAPRRVREWVKSAVELLAAVPSVVVGFFVLAILAGGVQRAFDLTYRLNALVAAIGLAFAVVPVVLTITEDALRTVPRELVEASLALGARRWQTTGRDAAGRDAGDRGRGRARLRERAGEHRDRADRTPRSGTKCPTASARARWVSAAANSNGSASRARSRCGRRFCCSTSRRARSIRSRPKRSKR